MNAKAKTTFKHRGQQFIEGIVYDIHANDFKYFEAAGWMEDAGKEKAVLQVAELGYDPETTWAENGKKVMVG